MTIRALGLVSAVALVACSAAPPAPAPRPTAVAAEAPTPMPPAPDSLQDTDWGLFTARRYLVQIPLPDISRWHVEITREWAKAKHLPSKSTLKLRVFRNEVPANAAACEASAHALHPDLPAAEDREIIEQRRMVAPPGYDTLVRLAVAPAAGGGLEGTGVAFGANVRSCLVIVFRTRVVGAEASSRVAERLHLFSSRIVPRTRNWDIDSRVHRFAGSP